MLQYLQGYDPGWRAYIVPAGQSLHWWDLHSAQAVPQEDHLRGNGYANAWWIGKRGSYTVTLWFWPQELTFIGGVLCWLTIVICSGYAMLVWQRSRFKAAAPTGQCRNLEKAAVAV
jgi:hypothetical protein